MKGTPGSWRRRGILRALLDAVDDHFSAPVAARARARGWHVLPVAGTREVVYRHPGFPRPPDPDADLEADLEADPEPGEDGCEHPDGHGGDLVTAVTTPSAAGATR